MMPDANIRNFVIISHIDHGKSTLADRFLEMTGRVSKDKMRNQYLDSMDLEREKGITIKMHPVRLVWKPNQTELKIPDSGFILNLIDTPGHIDFSYEISRALCCCEGAVLLVDATQGIQAQTVFNLEQAQKQKLTIIGAVNKIDVAEAWQIEQAKQELTAILGVSDEEILLISGKKGTNVDKLLERIISKIPPPLANEDTQNNALLALVFDSKYDSFSGVIAFIRVFSGEIKRGDKIKFIAQNGTTEVKEVGYFCPWFESADSLQSGDIGYIKTGVKEPDKVRVGDSITISDSQNIVKPLAGYKNPQPVLYLSVYPAAADEFDLLKNALSKLKLNDPAIDFQLESQMALGRGFRIGFLGSLHSEIAIRRLRNEFGLDLVVTSPQVIFEATLKNDEELMITSPTVWPASAQIKEAREPWAKIEIISPNAYFNQIFRILSGFSVVVSESRTITGQKSLIEAEAPLREIISGEFYEQLKSVTSGYGSFSFEQIGMRPADLVKLDVLVAGFKEEPFAKIVPSDKAQKEGRKITQKLKEILPSQQFAVSLQAVVDGKIIARETIKALRKDVVAPLYGGDVTRKKKLLEAQKRGKEKLKQKGRVAIPSQVFLDFLRS